MSRESRAAAALAALALALAGPVGGQATLAPASPGRPTLEEVRKGMAIPSAGTERGQLDGVGFATDAAQMAKVWDLAASPPAPELLGEAAPGVLGAICPHDDYVYAGRVYRKVLPLVTAKTVVVVGVFHRYRKFGAKDVLVFDTYRTWRTPDGPVPVSPLREEVLALLPEGDAVADAAMHDAEHSVEPLVQWLKHARRDVEVLPVIVPAARWERLEELASRLGGALATVAKARGLVLGRDLAVAISADAVHYGPDFSHVPFGEGGVDAYVKAVARDRAVLRGPLSGRVTAGKVRELFGSFVDPADPAAYRLTWCGRFSIPAGLLALERAARDLGIAGVEARPLAYATSVGWPELPVRDSGLGDTAPANRYHFVGYPGLAVVPAP